MTFRFARTLPPAAAPIPLKTILSALPAVIFSAESSDDTAFEEELKEYFHSRYCFLLSSGKAALTIILTALKELYPDRDEVLIPAFTCYSVPAAIKKAGLRIKLCDLSPKSLDFDQEQLQNVISENQSRKKLLCVLVTHLFGCPAELKKIREIVGPEIPVIEDAAQAMGEEIDGSKLGTSAEAGFFSLGRGKALATGEGGVIVTSRDNLGEKIAALIDKIPVYSRPELISLLLKTLLTNILQKPRLFWLPKSIPCLRLGETIYVRDFPVKKISPIQRCLARQWQDRLAGHRCKRINHIRFWLDHLCDRFQCLCHKRPIGSLIRLPILAPSFEIRERLVELSEQKGLGIMPAYPTTINEITELAGEFSGCQFPQANDLSKRLFTIPVHELLNNSDKERILSILRNYFSHQSEGDGANNF